MEGEELGGTFVVAVEELGITGLWTTIREVSSSSSRHPTGLVVPQLHASAAPPVSTASSIDCSVGQGGYILPWYLGRG
jgi:hypothetical protein